MKNINNIEREIQNLENRRREIEIERQKSFANLETLKQSVIVGKADVQTVEGAAVTLNTFDEMLRDIDSRIETFRADLLAIQAIEKREAILDEILKLDAVAEVKASDYSRFFTEFDAFVVKWSEKVLSARSELAEHQRLFWRKFSEIVPNVQATLHRDLPETEAEIESLIDELKARGAKLSALRSLYEFNGHRHRLSETPEGFRLPERKFSQVSNLILESSEPKR